MQRVLFLVFFSATSAQADYVVPTRTLRANAIITEMDVTLATGAVPNSHESVVAVIGQETRVTLYPGRPILLDETGPPAVVDRNQIVRVEYRRNGMSIAAEARALERGAIGDSIRIMNLSSRTTLFGWIQADGTVLVGQEE